MLVRIGSSLHSGCEATIFKCYRNIYPNTFFFGTTRLWNFFPTCLSCECNNIQTHNHLIFKQTLNHVTKLVTRFIRPDFFFRYISWTLKRIMSQNGQTHFKNLAANAARFLKIVWPFWDIMYERVKTISL